MFNQFLTGYEVQQIQNDYETLVVSPEATDLILEYAAYAADSDEEVDAVYKINDQERATELKQAETTGLQEIVAVPKLDRYPFGYLKQGDCVFYISTATDLEEPLEGFPVVPESLRIVDPAGKRWIPYAMKAGPEDAQMRVRLGNLQVGQLIPCYSETEISE